MRLNNNQGGTHLPRYMNILTMVKEFFISPVIVATGISKYMMRNAIISVHLQVAQPAKEMENAAILVQKRST